jgi:hypothetical protein
MHDHVDVSTLMTLSLGPSSWRWWCRPIWFLPLRTRLPSWLGERMSDLTFSSRIRSSMNRSQGCKISVASCMISKDPALELSSWPGRLLRLLQLRWPPVGQEGSNGSAKASLPTSGVGGHGWLQIKGLTVSCRAPARLAWAPPHVGPGRSPPTLAHSLTRRIPVHE